METNIRHSTPEDIDLILQMYDHSRSVMRADGNMTQWVGYPTREDIEEDITRGVSYIIEECKGVRDVCVGAGRGTHLRIHQPRPLD